MNIKITGKELSGLTDGELFVEMVENNKCPNKINELFCYEDCGANGFDGADCLDCWKVNLNTTYDINVSNEDETVSEDQCIDNLNEPC